jgi:hypothetical protein
MLPTPCTTHQRRACSESYRLCARLGPAEVLEADGRPEVEEVEARTLQEDHGVMVHGPGYGLEGGFDMAGAHVDGMLGVPGSSPGGGAF